MLVDFSQILKNLHFHILAAPKSSNKKKSPFTFIPKSSTPKPQPTHRCLLIEKQKKKQKIRNRRNSATWCCREQRKCPERPLVLLVANCCPSNVQFVIPNPYNEYPS
eukprot:698340_1